MGGHNFAGKFLINSLYTVKNLLSEPVWRIRIRIRGIRIISLDLDPDPYKKMAESGIRIRIK